MSGNDCLIGRTIEVQYRNEPGRYYKRLLLMNNPSTPQYHVVIIIINSINPLSPPFGSADPHFGRSLLGIQWGIVIDRDQCLSLIPCLNKCIDSFCCLVKDLLSHLRRRTNHLRSKHQTPPSQLFPVFNA